tara:strand:- start:408 stop:1112 length:705 start_codon:yes stop_codon:yes gene_type:complete
MPFLLVGSGGNVVLQTAMGEIEVELYWKHAPYTCYNMYELAKRGYYNGTIFHRIIKVCPNISILYVYFAFVLVKADWRLQDFMIQGGDPSGTGRGGQSIYGDKFKDELTKELKHTGAGILSMANSGPNTNSSQFFITLAPTAHLDGKHTIFGRVKSGMRIVQRIGNVATASNDRSAYLVTGYICSSFFSVQKKMGHFNLFISAFHCRSVIVSSRNHLISLIPFSSHTYLSTALN